jgi:hypothetical protein
MQEDQTTHDAARLLAALTRNHPEAMRGTPFTLAWDEPQRAGLNKARFDAAMWWLIEHELLERDEETEKLLSNVKGLAEYDYGLAFKITERGRELLRDAGAPGA